MPWRKLRAKTAEYAMGVLGVAKITLVSEMRRTSYTLLQM